MTKQRSQPEEKPEVPPEADRVRFIERPDGVYWRYRGRSEEFGPFKTVAEAEADAMARDDDSGLAPGESVAEAESEIGIADWIDPETGAPAEESVPRIKDN